MLSFFRLQRIAWILLKHRALFPLENVSYLRFIYWPLRILELIPSKKTRGERLADALYELGPIFIKIGQILSTRSDLIGQDLADNLAKLRDNLPPFPAKMVEKILKDEFGGRPVELLFASFEMVPVAAASIAQVHKAKTFDGNDVAVKILRPGIERAFQKDIKLFMWLGKLANYGPRSFKKFKLLHVIENIAEGIKIELDLRMEGSAASEIKENMADDPNIYVPSIFWDLTSRRVLTMEWIEGISIYNTEALKSKNFDLVKLSSHLALMFFNQAYRDGFYHADLHPGNILVDMKGRIVLVDFGIIGRLDKKNRLFVAEVLYGFLNKDYKKVADVHYKYGYINKSKNRQVFAQSLRAVGEPVVGKPVNEISIGKLLSQLIKMADDFEIEIRPEIVTLQKTIMLVEGIGSSLNKDVNMWKLVEPWIADWAVKNLAFDAKIVDFVQNMVFLAEEFVQRVKTERR